MLCTRTDEELWEVIDVFYQMEGLDFFVSTLFFLRESMASHEEQRVLQR